MGALRWFGTLPLKLRTLFSRAQVERDLDDELQFHLEQQTDEYVAQGLSPQDARTRALRELGGVTQQKERSREAWGFSWLTDFADDLRFAARSLRRAPGLTTFVILALGLGIGVSASSYSMLDALVFRPSAIPQPGRVMRLVGTSPESAYEDFSIPEYRDLTRTTTSYDGLVANGSPVGVGFAADARSAPKVVPGVLVSGNYFSALRVPMALGRGFRANEDAVPDRDAVAVVSHDFWTRELNADPAAVGRTVRLNGRDFTVVGVAPRPFHALYLFARVDVYVPISMARLFAGSDGRDPLTDRALRAFVVRGRLAEGVPLAQARAELRSRMAAMAESSPVLYRGRGSNVHTPFEMRTRSDDVNWKFGALFTLLGLATLLVACTNVAGLLLARSHTRTREIAVRLALGATRPRLVRFLLAEAVLLAAAGCVLGVGLGYLGIRLLQTFTIPVDLPTVVPFRMDVRVLAACVALGGLSAIGCGLAPALRSVRPDAALALRASEVSPGNDRLWGRQVLVVAQVAVSLMLVTATFLLARDFRATVLQAGGVRTDHILLARLDPRLLQYDDTRSARFYDQLVERLRALPGVESVGQTTNPPLGLDDFERLAFVPEGFDLPRDKASVTAWCDAVDPGFMATLRIPTLEGRTFTAADRDSAPRVAVVNQKLAEHYWPGQSAVGKRIRLRDRGGPIVEVIGVVPTLKYSGTIESATDFVYLPLTQHPSARRVVVVRTAGDPLAAAGTVRAAVREIDPDLPISQLRTYDDLHRYHSVEGPGVAIRLVGTMGFAAAFLAIAGLYGLMSYSVARRTREIGIRMAIGAQPRDILQLVMDQGYRLVAVGVALGFALSLGVERVLRAAIFPTVTTDWVTIAVAIPLMFAAATFAAWLPARRALRVSPTVALRSE